MLENTRKYALFFINFKSTTENETIQTRKTTNFTFWHSGLLFFHIPIINCMYRPWVFNVREHVLEDFENQNQIDRAIKLYSKPLY